MALHEFWKKYCKERQQPINKCNCINTTSMPSTQFDFDGYYYFWDSYKPWYSYRVYIYPIKKDVFKQAYEIIKFLVEEKIIQGPGDYGWFCELLIKLANKLEKL